MTRLRCELCSFRKNFKSSPQTKTTTENLLRTIISSKCNSMTLVIMVRAITSHTTRADGINWRICFFFLLNFPDKNLNDMVQNRENNNSYMHSINQSMVSATDNSDRRYLSFNADQVQCVCEALQQKGDIEKLSSFLWNLPPSVATVNNESVLR